MRQISFASGGTSCLVTPKAAVKADATGVPTALVAPVGTAGDVTINWGSNAKQDAVASTSLDISLRQYFDRTFEAVEMKDFVTGLVKAGVFGAIISSLACYLGLGVTGGAQGVGNATTRTVIVDLMFTAGFY